MWPVPYEVWQKGTNELSSAKSSGNWAQRIKPSPLGWSVLVRVQWRWWGIDYNQHRKAQAGEGSRSELAWEQWEEQGLVGVEITAQGRLEGSEQASCTWRIRWTAGPRLQAECCMGADLSLNVRSVFRFRALIQAKIGKSMAQGLPQTCDVDLQCCCCSFCVLKMKPHVLLWGVHPHLHSLYHSLCF